MTAPAQVLRVAAACLAGTVSLSSSALQDLSGRQFVEACAAYRNYQAEAGGTLCRSYLQGFLAGNPEVIMEEDLPSPFMQRVLRTKAPGRSERIESLTGSPYCLPEGFRLDELIDKINLLSGSNFDEKQSAAEVVQRALEIHYRCQR